MSEHTRRQNAVFFVAGLVTCLWGIYGYFSDWSINGNFRAASFWCFFVPNATIFFVVFTIAAVHHTPAVLTERGRKALKDLNKRLAVPVCITLFFSLPIISRITREDTAVGRSHTYDDSVAIALNYSAIVAAISLILLSVYLTEITKIASQHGAVED